MGFAMALVAVLIVLAIIVVVLWGACAALARVGKFLWRFLTDAAWPVHAGHPEQRVRKTGCTLP